MNTRKQMTTNARAYNRVLTDDYLRQFDDVELLGFTHPMDRPDFVRKLYNDGSISYQQMQILIKEQ